MKKQAYLIMAHNNFEILKRLLVMLDYPYHDIYIHVDKKVKNFKQELFTGICKKSSVFFTSERINVKWGHQTQVLTEMLLLETAYKNGDYSYFHIISGVDLPLEKPENIFYFFKDKSNSFILISRKITQSDRERVQFFRPKFRNYRVERLFNLIQRKLKINRVPNMILKKGANWASLTKQSVEVLIEKKKLIKKLTFMSSCADEIYKQTILYNFAKDTVYIDENGETDNLRYVDWSAGKINPKTLDEDDYDKIINSGQLFARKFDAKISAQLIDRIYSHVTEDK